MPRKEALLPSLESSRRGTSTFRDSHPSMVEEEPRIYVKFRPAGLDVLFWALLDTGAHFCLLNSTVAKMLRDQLTESLGTFSVRTAHGPVRGDLYLHPITLVAETGESLNIEATVFVPPEWQGPSFLGYAGALDRIRFAIDPRANRFYFGEL